MSIKQDAIEAVDKKRQILVGREAYQYLSDNEPQIVEIIERYIALDLTAEEVTNKFRGDYDAGDVTIRTRILHRIAWAAKYVESQK